MIYTVTFNPALDYVIQVDHFQTGQMNRIKEEHIYYGGKGINVSTVLQELGVSSCAWGFVAGFTGEELEKGLRKQGIQTDFVRVDQGRTRINVKMKSEDETEINGTGPQVNDADFQILLSNVERLKEGDVLVLSGNIPSTMKEDAYVDLLGHCPKGVLLVVDAEKELLKDTLRFHPFFIKPNKEELEALFHVSCDTRETIIDCARQLQQMGAQNVLVSLSDQGSLMVCEDQTVIVQPSVQGQVVNSVGAGDSMVAGVLAGWIRHHDWTKALQLGTACGAATAFHSGLATKEQIEELYRQL